jgi:hypothetical protein
MRIDAGAFEAQLSTLVDDNPADVQDGVYSPGNLTLREALAFNANPGPDVITFAAANRRDYLRSSWKRRPRCPTRQLR